MMLSQLTQGIEEDLMSTDPLPFTPPPIEYPQLIKDLALGQYIPFLVEVPPCNHNQEEAQVIDLITDIYNPELVVPVVT